MGFLKLKILGCYKVQKTAFLIPKSNFEQKFRLSGSFIIYLFRCENSHTISRGTKQIPNPQKIRRKIIEAVQKASERIPKMIKYILSEFQN